MREALIDVMGLVSTAFEIAGVGVIVVGFVFAAWRAARQCAVSGTSGAYETMRATFGRSVLLGLEILVAADLIRTIAVEPTLDNLAVLGALVVIRTFLAWALEVEIDGRWPWRRHATENPA